MISNVSSSHQACAMQKRFLKNSAKACNFIKKETLTEFCEFCEF